MEFLCVLSVNGSLASYQVQPVGKNRYKAVLQTINGDREDLPAEISLVKNSGQWSGSPWHEQIIPSLTHAIEANSQ